VATVTAGDATPAAETGPGPARALVASRSLAVACLGLLVGGGLATAQERVKVEVSRAGFKPKVLTLRKGETLRIVLSTADDEHCFAVDALRIEKRIVPGKTTEVDVVVDKAGTLPFYCCLEPDQEALRGRLVVRE
jgi:heme/copper-type cytochrome/quinol oxidase subunit 2